MISDSSTIRDILSNKVFFTTFWGWFAAQSIKVIIGIITEKRFNFKWFVGTGGMPSSHASGVTALATSIGIQEGVGTVIFAIAAMFAVVVIFDAQGVRHSTGKQAEVLNKILDDIYWKKRIQNDRLKELVGHTPIEVIIGICTGLCVAFLSYLGKF
ncbi:Acid phosphatase/vanadium-dependent haloperoxidase related protein [Candidatus Omnitrophus magneticus]|uniref:Acid phosphatase/vanadium-dependent haloperoxidase related protein n=1 Tax=Candidatus Omnitrophus magneticus TaxID=1609969 RepID=A0A0F0CQ16_9BACT|nr:Acid phosphatase/vanadium-dependent haloperoxidase related protein [Candidatus Omnitrophus magneticus]